MAVIEAPAASPDDADQLFQRARLAHAEGLTDAAEAMLTIALARDPAHRSSLKLFALLYRDAGRFEDAAELLTRLVKIEPDSAPSLRLYAEVLVRCGRRQDALRAFELAYRLDPSRLDALLNVGVLEAQLGLPVKAILTFATIERRFMQAGKPTALAAIVRRAGKAKQQCLGKLKGKFEADAANDPQSASPYVNYARQLARTGRFMEAVRIMERARERFPFDDRVPCGRLCYKLLCCDWQDYEGAVTEARAAIDIEMLEGKRPSLDTLIALVLPIGAPEQLALGRALAADAVRRARELPLLLPAEPRQAGAPITLGYLSGRFQNDANAQLMLGLFGRHDRRRFRVITYSFGEGDGSLYRRRIMADSDRFVDLRGRSDADAAQAMRADGVDILVDVDGFNPDARPVIAAQRPAPVQIRYLDYPATSGADFFDYYVTDPYATPPGAEADWSEQLVYLPHSYQANDRDQPIEPAVGGRKAHGLAEDAFVLASFCSMRKIEPVVFGAWMDILKRASNAVLWLLPFTADAARNLHSAAARHGVTTDRLVFAPYLAKPEHLGRMALADLSLDTLFWGGHTTTSDSLWAGVPVMTMPGRTFASRVAGSLLHAIGLPELIAPSLADYVELAVALAADRDRMSALRRRLAENRLTMPLFDTDRYLRGLERAYRRIWEIHERGEPPQSFAVELEPPG
jgi:predicted O-linked N-acetylglucosamine transferase (SPINDLY family)